MLRSLLLTTPVVVLTFLTAGCGDGGDPPAAADTEATAAPSTTTTTSAADAADDPDASVDDGRPVVFEAAGIPVPVVLTSNCNPADPTDCILPSNYSATQVTGDLTGEVFSASIVIGRNGVYPGASLIAFTGEVAGCGSGGLIITNVGTFDPSTGETSGRWTINADGGTGALADVAGDGTMTFGATGGRYEGTLRCR